MSAGFKRLVPERTIDSLFAAEVVLHLQDALIWSPSQFAGSWDHQIATGSRFAIFEAKAVISDARRDPSQPWVLPVRKMQLQQFAFLRGLNVLYLLPAKPPWPESPWWRADCQLGDCLGEPHCLFCRNSSVWQDRKWSGTKSHIATAPVHVRLQPWFCHWCWVVPARELARIPAIDVRQGQHYGKHDEPTIAADDSSLSAIPNAVRLCHWLAAADVTQGLDSPIGLMTLSEQLSEVGLVSREQLSLLEESVAEADETPPIVAAFN
ncbi:hypothetical protein GCM10009554_77700 [Kribbella koreensis]|uniref:Uncharacterized protein n=1 Tax=Kribbella koreensis TaxID=57909 RepID=A0ABP4C6L8_9ACTN